jgi:hypothetical protein
MSKSIVIFGKGPSLSRCTREFVDNFDDIAICNYPHINTFFNSLIKNRTILYHFANCGSFDKRYTDNVNKHLHIKGIYNSHYKGVLKYKKFLQDTSLFKENIREPQKKFFKQKGFDPSTGTLGFKYILDSKKYNKIALVGFDNFKKGDPVYYYPTKDYNDKIKYIVNRNDITKEGIQNVVSGHDSDKTQQYYESVFTDYSHIQFDIITNMNIQLQLDNLTII